METLRRLALDTDNGGFHDIWQNDAGITSFL